MIADLGAKYDALCTKMDALAAAMSALAVKADQLHSVAMREWEPFTRSHGIASDANKNATITFDPARLGFEGMIERCSVAVDGASGSATVTVYRNSIGPTNIVDYASGLFGSSPAVSVADYSSPIYVANHETIIFVVAGTAAVGNNVTVRIEGRRRQV